jgi:hypothetical protein
LFFFHPPGYQVAPDFDYKNSLTTKHLLLKSIAADENGKSCLGQKTLWSDHEAKLLRAFRSRRRQVFTSLQRYIQSFFQTNSN